MTFVKVKETGVLNMSHVIYFYKYRSKHPREGWYGIYYDSTSRDDKSMWYTTEKERDEAYELMVKAVNPFVR